MGSWLAKRKEGYQFLIKYLCINVFPPWNHRPAGDPVGGPTAGTRPSPADRVRCRRPHTVAEFSAEPLARACVFHGTHRRPGPIHAYTGASRPPPVGGNSRGP